MSRQKPTYEPGTASKMGRPRLDVATEKIQAYVLPETMAAIKAVQKKHGCTLGQALDKIMTGSHREHLEGDPSYAPKARGSKRAVIRE